MEKRVGFIGIIISDRKNAAEKVNSILSEFGAIIVARTGIPYHTRNVCVITLVVDATTDEIGSLTGRLGTIKGVTVKSGVSRK
ncbi:MAG: CopG family transcriptional regulator [Lentisphaerae bacterium RIFOXYA12_FULL_48_11]|nr:MAG: CopG family transcriptional regulator [Lentisphaerae bacterium RIFOXYA12_FULL_48_11]